MLFDVPDVSVDDVCVSLGSEDDSVSLGLYDEWADDLISGSGNSPSSVLCNHDVAKSKSSSVASSFDF